MSMKFSTIRTLLDTGGGGGLAEMAGLSAAVQHPRTSAALLGPTKIV